MRYIGCCTQGHKMYEAHLSSDANDGLPTQRTPQKLTTPFQLGEKTCFFHSSAVSLLPNPHVSP